MYQVGRIINDSPHLRRLSYKLLAIIVTRIGKPKVNEQNFGHFCFFFVAGDLRALTGSWSFLTFSTLHSSHSVSLMSIASILIAAIVVRNVRHVWPETMHNLNVPINCLYLWAANTN